MKNVNVILPYEPNPKLDNQTMILIESLLDQGCSKDKIYLINHSKRALNLPMIKFLRAKGMLKSHYAESITNHEFYYKEQSYFLLMPATLKYASDYLVPAGEPLLMLDPDVICNKFELPELVNDEVYGFKSPLNDTTKVTTYALNRCLSHQEANKYQFKNHYDTWFIYTRSRQFIHDWYFSSVDLTMQVRNDIHTPQKKVSSYRVQQFNQEIAFSNLELKHYDMFAMNDSSIIGAVTDETTEEINDIIMDCNFYHYDYSAILANTDVPELDKYRKMISKDVIENDCSRVFDECDVSAVCKDIDSYLEGNEPKEPNTKRVLRLDNLPYDFND